MPIFQLTNELVFPHPALAEDGLLAIGGDLRPERLLLAYSNGIFPWPDSEEAPILWASPDPRLVLFLEKFTITKRLERTIRQGKFSCSFDENFADVIRHCRHISRRGQRGTWITKDMMAAYIKMFHLGYAHSVETYLDGQLVGGIYGLSLGGAFFGESMFHLVSDASKVAVYFLVQRLREWDFDFLDAQISSPHLLSWGAEEISRDFYLQILKASLHKKTHRGKW
ncbi:leucyl/phenylalanyl-tRNA--protein transferase [candidate division KSB1 bacterium]|nr:leucyl/phenylalanyl-tRNA--protein transferase [candidate division KSB1 bacterium]RQW03039.1 MAG: leucyl/phenylalanyl-tRNA--protein transferase [candidate division KSB1 bacterium]